MLSDSKGTDSASDPTALVFVKRWNGKKRVYHETIDCPCYRTSHSHGIRPGLRPMRRTVAVGMGLRPCRKILGAPMGRPKKKEPRTLRIGGAQPKYLRQRIGDERMDTLWRGT